MAIISFQIKQIPDLTLNKYASLSSSGVDGVLQRHSSFLRQWYGIGKESNTSFHLLYTYLPEETKGNRLKIYFMMQGDEASLKHMTPLLNKSPLSDFYSFTPCDIPTHTFEAGATLVKKERIANIYNPFSGSERQIHYVPKWSVDASARLYDLFRMMETIASAYESNKPCAYRIDIYPTSMSEETRNAMTPIIKELQGENDIQLVKDSPKSRDNYAYNVQKEYEDWMSKVDTSPMFRVNIYGFAESAFLAKVLLNAAASEAIEEGDFSLAPIKADTNGKYTTITRLNKEAGSYCFYPNKAALPSWATTYTLAEVEPFFRLPALYDGESIEIGKETMPKPFSEGIDLGLDEQGYSVLFPIEDLPRHAFFTGMPGSGKTNTMLHMVSELTEKKIPFLVMEPAKKEYRELLGDKKMKNVYLFSPHLQSHFPLRMNPFAFPLKVRLSEHINALLEVFQGSFYLEGAVYKFLSSSIIKAYEDLGWDMEETNQGDKEYPTLNDVYKNLEAEIEKSTYDNEFKGSAKAFLQIRLGGLMERDAGELFCTSYSTLQPEEWLDNSAIVELEVLNEQAKNFFVLLVCHYILETLRSDPKKDKDKKVRHVIFIEEAHNIISSTSSQDGDNVNPKISATAYIVKMLAEVRALREAIVIADQLPTALTSEVTKNTGLKLVHRLTSQDDRELIGTAISASSVQFEQMSSFTKGEALIHYEKTLKPYKVQIHYWEKPKINYDFANDEQLYTTLMNNKTMKSSIWTAVVSFSEKHLLPLVEEFEMLQKKLEELSFDDYVGQMKFNIAAIKLRKKFEKTKVKCDRIYHLWNVKSIHEEDIKKVFKDIYADIDTLVSCVKKMETM